MRVEYIQSSGTQYIDTGFSPSNNTKVQFKLSNYSINSSIQYVFGSTSLRGNNMFGLLGTTSWSGDTINGHLLYNTSEYKLSSGNIGNGGTHTGELSSNGFYVDGTRIRTVSGTFTGTLNMTIFAGNVNGIIGANEKGSFKLYYFKVYESGTLVRDFVPCYKTSNNEIGLFDKVENKFYANSGTGTFTKGNDVKLFQPELKNAYIGEVGEYTISNIPTTDTNVYVNVARSGKTIQSVKFKFTATYISSRACYVLISSNNSNTNRYGLSFGVNTSGSFASVISIRGRLGGSDTYYRQIASSISGAYNIEYMISRDGNCVVKYNGNTTNYTATGTELTVIQTIMNLSNMNVYAAQNGNVINGNKVNVEVAYS